MEEIMTRIADALERVEAIQTNSTNQVKQYQQLRADLAKDIQKALDSRPTIQNQLDPDQFAAYVIPALTGKLPDPSAIRAAGQDILNGIEAYTGKIPTEVKIKGNFYGMASQKAFLAYMGFLLGVILMAVGTSWYYWHQAQEKTLTKLADELNAQQAYYQGQIITYKRDNPKYGAKYFPDYDKSKLDGIVNQLRQERATSQP